MNITTKIIITDTNIITDLDIAKILKQFICLKNVYISDLIKKDEINSNTCNISIINDFKVIEATSEELSEISIIRLEKPQLSTYDALNFIIARDNNAILATGDNNLRKYSESNGVEVIRTLKIIELMLENSIITNKEALNACVLLKENSKTRIPEEHINNLINKLEKNTVLS